MKSMMIVVLLMLVVASAQAFVTSRQTPTAFVTPSNKFPRDQVIPQSQNLLTSLKRNNKECTTILFMGWGPEPIWSAATVKSNQAANQSGKSVSIKVTVPPETAMEYKIPGQYVQFRLNEGTTKPLFLAIASAPTTSTTTTTTENTESESEFEFLIKKTPDNAWITDATPGTKVEISQVLGGGFPMSENLEGFKYDFPTQNVLLFGVGSGIAPIKAAMESGQLNIANAGTGGRTARLYYGVQTAEDLCFVDKFPEWEKLGYQVVPVLSQPSPEWNGRTGYVQNCLEEDGVPIPRNSGALLCGMKGMAESVKDILIKAGVFDGRILTNF